MKVIVVHPGRQHSFRLAEALHQKGLLHSYVTSVYVKRSDLLFRLAVNLPKLNKRFKRRFCLKVPEEKIRTERFLLGILILLVYRIDRRKNVYGKMNRIFINMFGLKVAKYIANENVDAVISYDNASYRLFTELVKSRCEVLRIIDHAHPPRNFLHNVYNQLMPPGDSILRSFEKNGYIRSKQMADFYRDELLLGQKHIVASTFSEAGLKFSGVLIGEDSEIIPYGVNYKRFGSPMHQHNSETLKVLFVGELNQRKGLREIIEVASTLSKEKFEFNLIGEFYGDSRAFTNIPPNVNFLGRVTAEVLQENYKEADVFLFPSYGEGFGLVLLEAMASSCVVIASKNCAGPDLLTEDCGFTVNAGDVDIMAHLIEDLYQNPKKMRLIAKNATEKARNYSWELYNDNIVRTVNKWLD